MFFRSHIDRRYAWLSPVKPVNLDISIAVMRSNSYGRHVFCPSTGSNRNLIAAITIDITTCCQRSIDGTLLGHGPNRLHPRSLIYHFRHIDLEVSAFCVSGPDSVMNVIAPHCFELNQNTPIYASSVRGVKLTSLNQTTIMVIFSHAIWNLAKMATEHLDH